MLGYKKLLKPVTNGEKRKFNRAADCYGAIPVVFRTTLANLDAGFAFNKDKEREAIKREAINSTLI